MFLVVKAYNRVREPDSETAPAEDVLLLREIRDGLRAGTAAVARTGVPPRRDAPPTTPPA